MHQDGPIFKLLKPHQLNKMILPVKDFNNFALAAGLKPFRKYGYPINKGFVVVGNDLVNPFFASNYGEALSYFDPKTISISTDKKIHTCCACGKHRQERYLCIDRQWRSTRGRLVTKWICGDCEEENRGKVKKGIYKV